MRPCSSTTTWSASRMVDSRWAMMKVVRPCIRSLSAFWMRASVIASRALVASSRIRIGGFLSSARAMASRWGPPPGKRVALAARQRRAALADQRFVALGLAQDEIMGLGEPRRLLDLGLRGVGLADAQV